MNFFPNKRWDYCPFDHEYYKDDKIKIKVKNSDNELQLDLLGDTLENGKTYSRS